MKYSFKPSLSSLVWLLAPRFFGCSLPEGLRVACDHVSQAAHFDASLFAATLWKRGGHPEAPRTHSQLAALAQLRETAVSLSLPAGSNGKLLLREEPSHAALWADSKLRHDMAMAGCTLACIHHGENGHTLISEQQLGEIADAVKLQESTHVLVCICLALL